MRKGLQRLFSDVSRRYELVNHVLTLGLDIFWRRKAAKVASLLGGYLLLDVCSGTGEMAYTLLHKRKNEKKIVSVDFCFPMIKKAQKKRKKQNISFVIAEACHLPFPDETFELITISFATRNINTSEDSLKQHLREFNRVLKRGGYFVNLETSQPQKMFLRRLFHLYVKLLVRPVGFLISGSKAAYRYLSFTIPKFYTAEELSALILQAGYSRVTSMPLLFGVSAIHICQK